MTIDRSYQSPNYGRRPWNALVSCIVLHADADSKVSSAITYCCQSSSKVSYHAIVGRLGDVYELVSPDKRAWHAGVSAFDGVPDCNNYSVGVCLSNRNDGVEPFTEAALRAAADYCAMLMQKFPAITLERITTHRDVALPAGRKIDPHPTTWPHDAFLQLVADARQGLA